MRLGSALQEKLMDVRLRDKLLAEGKISKAEVNKFMEKLTDDANNATETTIEKVKSEATENQQKFLKIIVQRNGYKESSLSGPLLFLN